MVSSLILGLALGAAAAAEPEAAKPAEADRAAYESARASAGRDADAHVALALWCEAHGMTAEKATHLARAVLLDPANARARGLLGYVQHDGRWMRPEEVSKAVEESPEAQALFGEYQQRRIQARDRADDQYKLARWCDEHGLAQQATAHYHRVVELDPGRDSAWRRLGFKKVSGRWIKPELLAAEKAEREAQEKADRFWKPKLEKLKDALSGRDRAKKAEALEALAKIDDPRAAPMVWKVFARGDERWQRVAAQVLGQIDGPAASEALAVMAVFSPVANIRSEAMQRLMRRDPRDFATLLAGLLREEIRYKVKPVEGPGSQGELFVEGKDANVRRRYTPLQRPVTLPGDRPGVTDFGMYIVNRDIGIPYVAGRSMSYDEVRNSMTRPWISSEKASALFQAGGLSQGSSQALAARLAAPPAPLPITSDAAAMGTPLETSNYQQIRTDTLQIPMEWMIAEARASAVVAQRQLTYDVAQIESHNAPIREVNERASSILRGVSGQDLGVDPQKWTAWAVDLQGYALRSSSPEPTPPTVTMDVPLDFQPQAVPTVTSRVVGFQRSHSCFAAGTLVRTLRGARPIESIRPGDQVLTQDTADGRFDYRPVVTAYHNPPNETYRLDLGGESIVATGIHRFWKAGRGWVMARDVKPGDRLRTVGGAVEVVAVSKDKVQPVFNLRLDGGDDFCVGESGVVAHDNSFVEPVENPFDAVPALAAASTRTP